jgi:hypothetical protein
MIPIAVAPHDRRLQPGGTVVEPGREKWGSYGGSFADPGGYLLCVGVGARVSRSRPSSDPVDVRPGSRLDGPRRGRDIDGGVAEEVRSELVAAG